MCVLMGAHESGTLGPDRTARRSASRSRLSLARWSAASSAGLRTRSVSPWCGIKIVAALIVDAALLSDLRR